MEAKDSGGSSGTEPERIDLALLAIGKKAGLSFEEINLLRVQDLLAFVEIYTEQGEEDVVKEATQIDFDTF